MIEFEVGGQNYRAEKLDAMRQFHVMRRLAPVMARMAESFGGVKALAEVSEQNIGEAVAKFEPVLEALGEMKDADAEFVVNTCLAVVLREQEGGKGWAKVQASNGRLMFSDIELPQMMRLVWKVLEDSLKGFFSELGSRSDAPA